MNKLKIIDKEILEIISGAKSRFELWGQVLTAINAKSIAEIGVWKGDFAKLILEQCEFIDHYHMIDPWANLPDWNKPYNVATEVFDDIYKEAMEKTSFASNKIVVHRGKTNDVISEIPDGSLDFAYIDGDHTLRGITIDLIQLLPKIKEGGFIGGDDFSSSTWQHGAKFEPTLVCPFSIYFSEAKDLPIAALPFGQFLIKKTSEDSFCFVDLTGDYSDISLNRLPSLFGKDNVKRVVKHLLCSMGIAR